MTYETHSLEAAQGQNAQIPAPDAPSASRHITRHISKTIAQLRSRRAKDILAHPKHKISRAASLRYDLRRRKPQDQPMSDSPTDLCEAQNTSITAKDCEDNGDTQAQQTAQNCEDNGDTQAQQTAQNSEDNGDTQAQQTAQTCEDNGDTQARQTAQNCEDNGDTQAQQTAQNCEDNGDTQAQQSAQDSESDDLNAPSLKTPKRLILRYRYEKLLGEGSNGKTYLAKDRQTGNSVAIKALKLIQLDNFKSFELFKREAETLSCIQVPGVPKFYESILSENLGEECYIVQEYVDAPSIQSYLDAGRVFTEKETRVLMTKIAKILLCLHTQYSPPIIHRDIKPSNILCALPDNEDWSQIYPHLIDFGAVANAHSNSDKSTIAGTIGYMAPEQIYGECLPQTDFYALGATAVHMLTGVAPYDMESTCYPLPFEPYLPDTISAAMRDLLKRLLSRYPNERPANAHILLQEITDFPKKNTPKPLKPLSRITQAYIRCHAFLEKLSQTLSIAPTLTSFFDMLRTGDRLTGGHLAAGTLRCVHDLTSLEYTFTVNNATWTGISEMPVTVIHSEKPFVSHKPADIPTLKQDNATWEIEPISTPGELPFPGQCVILYHPDDPSCNTLYYVYKQGKKPPAGALRKRDADIDFHWDTPPDDKSVVKLGHWKEDNIRELIQEIIRG